ncbi:hypothetical protein MNBD_BACTEROID07-77 [hydrothermal vent metagenome]|uniref:Uncharacterized protein n=1 Tax=hydrothermal vent metagenome TaxID=652676 RepID=A0A3B0USN5_9ZZZZ
MFYYQDYPKVKIFFGSMTFVVKLFNSADGKTKKIGKIASSHQHTGLPDVHRKDGVQ